jgi:hypothetical protein
MAKKTVKQPEVISEDSAALQTLHPQSRPVESDPKSRFEYIASMIGAAAAMRDDDLQKWWHQALESVTGAQLSSKVPGSADANKATIENKGGITPHAVDHAGPPSTGQTHVPQQGTIAALATTDRFADPVPFKAEANLESVNHALKAAAKEDLQKILGEQEGLSEEFKTKTATLFEAAIEVRVGLERAKIEEEVSEIAEQQLNEAIEGIEGKLDEYLDYTTAKWLEENEIAVESSLRNEITEEFMTGLKNLFAEHYIDIPEDRVDVVEQLSKTVDDLETRLNELIAENADLKSTREESEKKNITEEMAQGLTLVESEKLKEFAKTIDADDVEEFKTKLTTIKNSNFVQAAPKGATLNEQLEEVDEDNAPADKTSNVPPQMKSYMSAISRTAKR